MSAMFRSFVAGQLATLRELTLFYAPNINSYKRFVDGSFAPTAVAWGYGQPHLRAAGGRARSRDADGMPRARRRRESVPGRRRLIAGGLHGIEQGLELEPACTGNAYSGGAPRLPTTLAEAADLFAGSAVARAARRRRRRPLPQQCACRTDGLQRRRHGLGKETRL